MADLGKSRNKQDESSFRVRGLGGSLSLRILFVTMIFLVLPLLMMCGIMYWHEYQSKQRDNLFRLNILASTKSALIDQYIAYDEELLDVINQYLKKEDDISKPPGSIHLGNLFQRLAIVDRVSEVFYAAIENGGQYVTVASSNTSHIGKNVSKLLSGREYTKHNYVHFAEKSTEQGDHNFYVTRGVYSPKTGRFAGVIAIEVNGRRIMQKLMAERGHNNPIEISIINAKGEVLTSSNVGFLQKQFKEHAAGLNEVDLIPDQGNYRFEWEGGERIATIAHLEDFNHFLMIDTSADVNVINVQRYLFLVAAFFFAIVVLGGGGTFWFTFRIAKPLKQLSFVMKRVGKGELGARFVRDPMGFEINIVGDVFNKMVHSLLHHINEVKNEKVQKEMFAKELKIGQEVQMSLLPEKEKDYAGVDIASGFVSAKEVGGDFYDIIVHESNGKKRLMVTVADASGKGIFACFYSLCLRSILRTFGHSDLYLDQIITKANNIFCKDTGESCVFVTAWLAHYMPETRELTYNCSGHIPAILKRSDGTIERLDTEGMALGVMEFDAAETKTLTLNPGDTLVVFTDGVNEAHNPKQELYGDPRLIEVIKRNTSPTAQDLVTDILKSVREFGQSAPQHDDTTLIVLKA